jgi:hypothetical protein
MKKLAARVYSTYAKSRLKQEEATDGDLVRFLGELANLGNKIQVDPILQTGNERIRKTKEQLTECYINFATAVLKMDNWDAPSPLEEQALEDGDKIVRAFIHYRRSKEPCSERVYLNVKRPYRVFVFEAVLGPLYRYKFEGLVSAKLAGPVGDDRADNIVVYTRDKTSSDRVVDALWTYQRKGFTYCFGGETPLVTSKVRGLIGVSTGREPPLDRMQLTSSGRIITRYAGAQSFGSTRADMIAQAMVYVEKNPAGFFARNKTKFKEKVAELFRRAGINPDSPAEQAYQPSRLTEGPLLANGQF